MRRADHVAVLLGDEGGPVGVGAPRRGQPGAATGGVAGGFEAALTARRSQFRFKLRTMLELSVLEQDQL